jgi:hypothetical protein
MTVGGRGSGPRLPDLDVHLCGGCLALSMAITLFFVTDFVLTRLGVFKAIPSDPV